MKKTRIQRNLYLEIYDSLEDASFSLAERVVDVYQKRDSKNFVVPGGNTPKTFYNFLAACLYRTYQPLRYPTEFLIKNYHKPIYIIVDEGAVSQIVRKK